MRGENSLLLKTFFLSLLIHIIGISLFAIVLPFPAPSKKPIEVSILPPSMAPRDINLAKADIIPDIPEISTHYEKVTALHERETVKFSVEQFTGFPDYIPFTQMKPNFEFPEFIVKFPPVAEFKTEAQPVTMPVLEIEGLAGERTLAYREKIEYPDWAQRRGIEGNIKIKFWVAPGGRITSTRINISSGSPELDIYAEENFRKWFFEPAKTEKEVWGIITLRFRLR